jgi:hypothetical protein
VGKVTQQLHAYDDPMVRYRKASLRVQYIICSGNCTITTAANTQGVQSMMPMGTFDVPRAPLLKGADMTFPLQQCLTSKSTSRVTMSPQPSFGLGEPYAM